MLVFSRPYTPFIPEEITIHLGNPDEPANNITITFPDYIKNIASNEIYPTWPESAIRANIYAQITFALNRIFTEQYRNRGYDFDITSSKKFDQTFIYGSYTYENISEIVDEIFDSYIARKGNIEPISATYCDGKITICDGLSQWGTVDLARNGYSPYEILQYYYGENIEIITDVPIISNLESYPLYPLQLGSFGRDVFIIQQQLNRISENYPAIPKIEKTDGYFRIDTDAAVRAFQRIFNLTENGIIERNTWYKIKYIYNAVKRFAELESEGLTPEEIASPFAVYWQEGDSGIRIKVIQYYVRALGCYYPDIPIIEITGYFGPETTEAVMAIEKKFNIWVDGIVDIRTWAVLDENYKKIYTKLPEGCMNHKTLYPGYILSKGIADKNVTLMQTYLKKISEHYSFVPPVTVTGIFDEQTDAAVRAIQKKFSIDVSGLIGAVTWPQIAVLYENLNEQFKK